VRPELNHRRRRHRVAEEVVVVGVVLTTTSGSGVFSRAASGSRLPGPAAGVDHRGRVRSRPPVRC
jgi:hypothetical protein